jgi:hypothetical protein
MSPEACPVLRVKSTHPSQGDWVEINAADYDPARHSLFDPAGAPAAEPSDAAEPPRKGKTRKGA